MKKSILLSTMLLLGALTAFGGTGDSVLPSDAKIALIEQNLFNGLEYNNMGLQRSCALMLGKIHSENAVIPLMKVLHNSSDEDLRIAAAWALCKIGDPRGVYAVKMAVKFDDCLKVQAVCAWYYENLVKQGTFTFTQPEVPGLATTE
jgi:hypothetical protein